MNLVYWTQGKITRLVQRHGLVGGLLHVAAWPGRALLTKLSPGQQAGLAFAADQSIQFDREFGVNTHGAADINTMSVTGGNRKHGEYYFGSNPPELREALTALPIAHDMFAFVDYGSGKGRAMFIAAEYPFKFIVGVEFAEELHRACQANLATYRNPARRCLDIRPIHQDAATFDPPEVPLVLYFFNPFDRVIYDAVLTRLDDSLRLQPRPAWIIYANPKDRGCFDDANFLELVAEKPGYCVYKSVAGELSESSLPERN